MSNKFSTWSRISKTSAKNLYFFGNGRRLSGCVRFAVVGPASGWQIFEAVDLETGDDSDFLAGALIFLTFLHGDLKKRKLESYTMGRNFDVSFLANKIFDIDYPSMLKICSLFLILGKTEH